MITNNQRIKVEPIILQEHSRKAKVIIDRKTILTPCYMSKVRSSDELDIICDNNRLFNHIQGFFYDIYNVKDVTWRRETNSKQVTLLGTRFDEDYLYLKNNRCIFIDPCTEYFYLHLQGRDKYSKIHDLPHSIKDMLSGANHKNHYSYWDNILNNTGEIYSIINWYIKYQSAHNADLIIPPSPLIDGNNKKLVDYAIDINRQTSLLAEGFNKPSAIYFPINFKVFSNNRDELKEIIKTLVEDDEELNNVKMIFIKIVNYNFNANSNARNTLNDFLIQLGFIARNTERGVFLLDADSLGLIALFNNIDGFVEPLNAVIRQQLGSSSQWSYKGKYYHPEKLEFIPHEQILREFNNNGKTLPCTCYACSEVNGMNLQDIDKNIWNEVRRRHLLYCRDHELEEIDDAIKNNQTRGISEKIYRSSFKNYIDLVPNSF